jgi:hypothetical protein
MNKGFLISLLYYLIGFGLAALSYATLGHGYNHAPGPHYLIILLVFIVGFLWLIVATILYFKGHRTKNLRATIFTNLIMNVGFVIFVIYLLNDDTENREPVISNDKVTIEEHGDTTTMYRGGSPVYIKVKDSVLINFIDSARIDWNAIEHTKK